MLDVEEREDSSIGARAPLMLFVIPLLLCGVGTLLCIYCRGTCSEPFEDPSWEFDYTVYNADSPNTSFNSRLDRRHRVLALEQTVGWWI